MSRWSARNNDGTPRLESTGASLSKAQLVWWAAWLWEHLPVVRHEQQNSKQVPLM
jgi:hypothetical protein